jgi:hypothetical protein
MTLETSERAVRRDKPTQFCACCRRSFNNRRQDARFCSIACKQSVYRRRLEAKAVETERARASKETEAERAREVIRKAIDLAHALIG